MPSLFSVVSWIIFYIVEVIGTNIITIPIMMLLFELASGFILCTVLYEGSFRKKLIWIFLINLMGMITEAIVGYIFIFVNMSVEQLKLLGSFISKIILLMILFAIKLFYDTRLKRDIPISYWCILFLIPIGSMFVLNTLFTLCEKANNKNLTMLALVSSAFVLIFNFIIFQVYENLSNRLEVQKQQIIFNKQIELCKNQIHEREKSDLNIKNIKHDIKNHLICIYEYLERKDLQYAKKYIDSLLDEENYFNSNFAHKF